MKRHICEARPNWQSIVEEDGLLWHSANNQAYWLEGAYYAFSPHEITAIETATAEIYQLFLAAGDRLVSKEGDWLDRFQIPRVAHDAIRAAWEQEPPSLNYGRFDFGFGEDGVPRLFEFNCDTPTSLLEASVIQWRWKESLFPKQDQFNSLHEKLIARWTALHGPLDRAKPLHFTHAAEPSGEDAITTAYMRDTAEAAGFSTKAVIISDIGLDADGRFVDQDDLLISQIFKLYPWEWMVGEHYAAAVIDQMDTTAWIEPIWKMLWSNKAILALLYDMAPDCPYLLPASLDGPTSNAYVQKPLLSREGANISIIRDGLVLAGTGGGYGAEGYVYQQLYDLPSFDGAYPIIGSWVVDGDPAGMGVREDGLITSNVARFVPHIIDHAA